jgi:hypothetical protein
MVDKPCHPWWPLPSSLLAAAAALLGLAGFAVSILAPAVATAAGAGRRLPTRTLVGSATGDSVQVQLSWEYDPLLFQLNAFRDRYKVVRIELFNKGQQAFVLSAAGDRLVALVAGRPVPAILDLGGADPAVWDSLAGDMRRDLAYPAKVGPGDRETVFAYLKDLPPGAQVMELRYSIASFPASPIVLRQAAAMAR